MIYGCPSGSSTTARSLPTRPGSREGRPHGWRPVDHVIPLLAILVLAGCGGEDGPTGTQQQPPPPPPATSELTVTVTPGAATVAAGERRQFSAEVRDEAGDLVNRTVTWTSSDESIATADGQGLVEAVAGGSVTITAAIEDASDDAQLEVPVPDGSVGSSGGTVSSTSHPVVLEVPAGALSEETPITIAAAPSDSLPAGGGSGGGATAMAGTAFDLAPDGLQFAVPALLEIGYDPAALPSGADEALLAVHRLTDGGWLELMDSDVDAGAGAVRAPIDGFSIYAIAVGVNDPPTVTIASPEHGATFAAGEEIVFEAEATDPEDGELSGSSIQWDSDLDGHLGIGTSFTHDHLTAGSHLITAAAIDGSHEELEGTDTVRITVEESEADLSVYMRSPNPPGSPIYVARVVTGVTGVRDEDRDPEDGLPLAGSTVCRDGLAVAPNESAGFLAQSNTQDVAMAEATFDVEVVPDAGLVTLQFNGFADAGNPTVPEGVTRRTSAHGATVTPLGSFVVAIDGVAGRTYDLEVSWTLQGTREESGDVPAGSGWSAVAGFEFGCTSTATSNSNLFGHLQQPTGSVTDSVVLEELTPGNYSMYLAFEVLAGGEIVGGSPEDTYASGAALDATVTVRVLGESSAP